MFNEGALYLMDFRLFSKISAVSFCFLFFSLIFSETDVSTSAQLEAAIIVANAGGDSSIKFTGDISINGIDFPQHYLALFTFRGLNFGQQKLKKRCIL